MKHKVGDVVAIRDILEPEGVQLGLVIEDGARWPFEIEVDFGFSVYRQPHEVLANLGPLEPS